MIKFKIVTLSLLMVGLLVAPHVFAAVLAAGEKDCLNGSRISNGEGFNACVLRGKTVRNQWGQKLGKVKDIVIGRDGRKAYVVLSLSESLGVGRKYVPIPLETFMSEGVNVAKAEMDKNVIVAFERSTLAYAPDLASRSFDLGSWNSEGKIDVYYEPIPRF